MTLADLQKLTPAFDWAAYFKTTGTPRAELNVEQPKFMQEIERELRETSLADWKAYLKWHLLRTAAPALSAAFVEESFDFYGRTLSGTKE